MKDILDLIVEARKRQEAAERELEDCKDYAKVQRERCRRIIGIAKMRFVPPSDAEQDSNAYRDHLELLVGEFARIFGDPYERYDDDGMVTLDRAKEMMVSILAQIIEDAMAAAKGGR